jgi:hypothetical protein
MGAIAEAIAAYAQPLLEQTDGSEEELNKAMALSQLCYNLALAPEDSRDQMLAEMQPTLQMNDSEFEEFRRTIIVPMIQRHQQMFPLMHRRGPADFLQGGPSLPAHSLPAHSRKEKYPGTEPYAPCPCGSGKKYKFCCKAKGR